MSGGIYDGHRGGYSSSFDTYSTWKNNTKGLYNEYRIDGSWMDDGDYDKAFKGYPSKKTVNIFMGGVYQEPSWKTTLLSGGIGLGITALGMWAMGLFGGKKAKPEQPSTALNLGLPTSGYWNSYFSNWQLPSLFGNQTPTNPPAANNNNDQTVQNPPATNPPAKPPTTPATTKAAGTAKNTFLNNEEIKGDITEIGNNNKDGYPEYFKITDTTHSKDNPTVYKFDFVKINTKSNKPVYQAQIISLSSNKDKKNDVNFNTYYIINDAIIKGKNEEKGVIKGNVKMTTDSKVSAVKGVNDLGEGRTQTYTREN